MRAVLTSAAVALVLTLFGTPLYIRFLVRRGYGQFIRDDGPTSHHTKRGTPDDGRRRHHPRHPRRLRRRAPGHRRADDDVGRAGPVPHDRARDRRVPRRLHQDLPAAQPRAAVGAEADRAVGRRGGVRRDGAAVPERAVPDAGVDQHLRRPRHRHRPRVRRPRPRAAAVRALGAGDRGRGQQRREPHRRPRRARHRRRHDGRRRVRHHRHLGVRAVLPGDRGRRAQLLRGARPARPRRRRRRGDGRLLRLPVVERLSRQDLHGRHRVAGPRRRPRRPGDHHPHRAAARRRSPACSSSSRCR